MSDIVFDGGTPTVSFTVSGDTVFVGSNDNVIFDVCQNNIKFEANGNNIVFRTQLGTAGGTYQHSELNERELPDQHPIEAITGLRDELDTIGLPVAHEHVVDDIIDFDDGIEANLVVIENTVKKHDKLHDWNSETDHANIPDDFPPSAHGHAHVDITGQTANDHHNQSHDISGPDHSGNLSHSSLSIVGSDDHHAKSHIHDGIDESGVIDHSDVINKHLANQHPHFSIYNIGANDHHNESHTHDGLDESGVVNYPNINNIPIQLGDINTAEGSKLTGIELLAEVNNISDINATDLTDGGETELHTHPATPGEHTHSNLTILDATTASFLVADESKLNGIESGAEVNNISDYNAGLLTGGNDTILHSHSIETEVPVRNYLVNSRFLVNQRGFTGWGAGDEFGYDMWRGGDIFSAVNIRQRIEPGRYVVSSGHTLYNSSGVSQSLTSPASGVWNIDVPRTWADAFLVLGYGIRPVIERNYQDELSLCQAFYVKVGNSSNHSISAVGAYYSSNVYHILVPTPQTFYTTPNRVDVSNLSNFSMRINGLSLVVTAISVRFLASHGVVLNVTCAAGGATGHPAVLAGWSTLALAREDY